MMIDWREAPRTDQALLALVARLQQRIAELERRLDDTEEWLESVSGDLLERTA